MLQRLRSISIPARVALGYTLVIVILAIEVLPYVATGDGLELMWVGFATFPTSILMSILVQVIPRPAALADSWVYVGVLFLLAGGLIQAWAIYKILKWLDRRSRHHPTA